MCCAPLHNGLRDAETPEALMRSRFSAFALGLGEYLARTLSETHADHAMPRVALVRELSRARERQRFLGLRVIHAATTGDQGEVLFFARVFERGADRSFAELSRFMREGQRSDEGAGRPWRYCDGVLVPAAKLPANVAPLTREAFLSLAQPKAIL